MSVVMQDFLLRHLLSSEKFQFSSISFAIFLYRPMRCITVPPYVPAAYGVAYIGYGRYIASWWTIENRYDLLPASMWAPYALDIIAYMHGRRPRIQRCDLPRFGIEMRNSTGLGCVRRLSYLVIRRRQRKRSIAVWDIMFARLETCSGCMRDLILPVRWMDGTMGETLERKKSGGL